jgi:ubiquinone/menaquinone biosynthesis C-methylase UbiE
MPEWQARQQYDHWAAVYDRWWQSYVRDTLTFLLTWTNPAPQHTILDIACGTGVFEHLVVADSPQQRMFGIDISRRMLDVARHKCDAYPMVAFQQARSTALPFAFQRFDIVVSANSFHYFDDPVTTLREMRRVLKPGGKLVILDWCKDFLLCRLCDRILHAVDPAHKHCYSQTECHALIAENGFRLQAAHRIRFGFVWGLMVATAIPSGCPG